MGLFQKLFKRSKTEDVWTEENEEEEVLDRDKLNMNDPEQLEKYVRNCCEQMQEATLEIDKATIEYRTVTDYLTDMEEIEQLPNEDRAEINAHARKLIAIQKDQKVYKSNVGGISDAQFYKMERIEKDMPAALDNLIKNEDYKMLVKQDLQNLEGEKASLRFRRRDLMTTKKSAKEISVIILFALIMTIAGLLFFQYAFEWKVQAGYFIAAGLGALALTISYVKYNNAYIEQKRVERNLNQIISLQNTVKIRYVNITSVIEYAYAKYEIHSSNELQYMWEKYLQEKDERKKLEEADEEIDYQRGALLKELRRQRLKDPAIWLHQAEALLDPKEMVEIRHGLIIRRQSMRKRIEYNTQNRENAKNEVKELVNLYPARANRILDIVSGYE